jgi:sodium-dependent dicarboxylate transporter 2/3/5
VSSRAGRWVRWVGLCAGPLVAVLAARALPEQYTTAAGEPALLTQAARLTFLLTVWMALWWLTEAIDIQATALLPFLALPLLGVTSAAEAAAPYADPLMFLFMGGFLMALSMQRWGLDRRLALHVLNAVGTSPARLVGGFMLATAGLSAFVSNTATTAMMLPIGISVIELFVGSEGRADHRAAFATCLMLSIAYAASIGGVGTIIGTPPNAYLVAFVQRTWGREISFIGWMAIGMPVVLVFLPLAWLLLTRVLFPLPRKSPEGTRERIAGELARLGPPSRGEWATLIVFALAALGWMTRPLLVAHVPALSDAGIAVAAGLVLFVLPVDARAGEFVLDWPTARRMPWGILILLGGGLSLAAAIDGSGVAAFLGSQMRGFSGMSPLVLTLCVTSVMIFLTELTSNAATTATLVPILAALAPGLAVNPYQLVVPATIAASMAFMLPVGTPPNALVFGSGHVTIAQMCRAGLALNLIGILVITLLMYCVALPLLAG